MSTSFQNSISQLLPEVVALRHDLHRHPELSRQEHRTSTKVRDFLTALPGFKIQPALTETDVVATLNADHPGPCLALRADMDALPLQEQTGKPYASQHDGVMHACGHDGHTAILLGVAKILAAHSDAFPGKIKLIFQPDEEDTGGAGRLCERGVLTNPNVDAIVALHGWPSRTVGTVSVRSGPVMAANTGFAIDIQGEGSHGAYPHRGIDPILVAAHIVTGLQSIISRTVNPVDPAVVTVGEIKAGHATNIIPAACRMRGTLRFASPEVGEALRARVIRIAEHTASAHGATAQVTWLDGSGYPPMTNENRITAIVTQSAEALLGRDKIIDNEPISMGVEDFAYYAQHVPACIFRVGVCPPDQQTYPGLHNPRYDFTDDALPVGMGMFCEITRRFFEEWPAIKA